MSSDRKINTQLSRSKFAIFLVVGFLALITYLLIVISNQLAQTESVTSESQAAMLRDGNMINRDNLLNQGNMMQGNEIGDPSNDVPSLCYSITGKSGNGYDPDPRRRTCTGLSYQCNLREYTEEEYNTIIGDIQRELESSGYRGQCSIKAAVPGVSYAKIECSDDTKHACTNFGGGAIETLLNNFCECPGSNEVSDPGNDVPPTTGSSGEKACGWDITQKIGTSPISTCSKDYEGAYFTCADGTQHQARQGCYDQQGLEDMMKRTCC